MNILAEIKKFLRKDDYEATPEGLLVHRQILARGRYIHTVNGQDERVDHNLLPAEGIAYLLDSGLGATAKKTTWYLTVFSGNVNPAANWTGVNFASNATEITSLTQGFSNATRPVWTPAASSGGVISNVASKAAFTIACDANGVNIAGAGLLSDNTRGGTVAGTILVSASRFSTVRTVYNADSFELGYEVELTDS